MFEIQEFLEALAKRNIVKFGWVRDESQVDLYGNYTHREYLRGMVKEYKGLTDEGDMQIDEIEQTLQNTKPNNV